MYAPQSSIPDESRQALERGFKKIGVAFSVEELTAANSNIALYKPLRKRT